MPVLPAHNVDINADIDGSRLYGGWYKGGLQSWAFDAVNGFTRDASTVSRTASIYHQAQTEAADDPYDGAWGVRTANIGGVVYNFVSDRSYGLLIGRCSPADCASPPTTTTTTTPRQRPPQQRPQRPRPQPQRAPRQQPQRAPRQQPPSRQRACMWATSTDRPRCATTADGTPPSPSRFTTRTTPLLMLQRSTERGAPELKGQDPARPVPPASALSPKRTSAGTVPA